MLLEIFERERQRNRELLAAEKLSACFAEGAGGGDGDGQDFDGVVERIVAERGRRSDQILAADERPLGIDAAGAVVREKGANEAERKVAAGDSAGLIVRETRIAGQICHCESRV